MSRSENWAEIKGLRIHYYEAGAGTPVFLLHGGGIDSATLSWKLTIDPLAQHFHVYAPDWPGYGGSDKPVISYTLDYYIRFLNDLMHALNIPEAIFAGISMGGGVAIGFSLQFPHLVRKLVLVDSYGLQRRAPAHELSYLYVRAPLLNEIAWALMKRSRAMVRAALRNIFHDATLISEELVDEVYTELRRPGAGKAFVSFQRHEVLRHGLRTVYVDRLHEINVSTLIVHGERDRLVPLQCAQQAHQLIKGSTLHILPECGHWPQREKPGAFHNSLLNFLIS